MPGSIARDGEGAHINSTPENQSSLVVLLVEANDEIAARIEHSIHLKAPWCEVHRVRAVSDLSAESLRTVRLAICPADDLDDGPEPARWILDHQPDLPVIVTAVDPPEGFAAEAVELGASDVLVLAGDELAALPTMIERSIASAAQRRSHVRAHAMLITRVAQLRGRIDDLEQNLGKYEVMASTDALTGLANRWRLREQGAAMFAEAVRHDFDLACIMLDLDNFKSVNDTLGHALGDDMLGVAGRIINAHIRASDFAARYGGDEFILLLSHSSAQDAGLLADRLQRAFHLQIEALITEDRSYDCGLSAGVASLRSTRSTSLHDLLMRADEALKRAKIRRGPSVIIDEPLQERRKAG